MTTHTEKWLALMAQHGRAGTSDELLDRAAAGLGIELPPDYRAVMRRANGGEANFGESAVRLWRAEDLADW